MERAAVSTKFPIGSILPKFSLPATDGNEYGQDYLLAGSLALVVFTCNHCPYVKGSEMQLVDLIRRTSLQGLRAVMISANDVLQYPEDSFEKMCQKHEAMNLPCPYLYDQTQQVARLFDAQCTPEVFLFDASAKLIYQGAINDSPRDSTKVTKSALEIAVQQALNNQPVDPVFVHPIGCSIKWKN